MGVKADLDKMAGFLQAHRASVKVISVDVRTASVRKALKLKAKDPLEYKGFQLKCRGSLRWRAKNSEAAMPETP